MRHGQTGPEGVASELDRRVAERTKDLAETNRELQLQAGLLQHLPVSAWTLKPDGTPDFVNQVWLEYSGQTLDFVRSHPEAWMTAIHPADREAASGAFWEGVRSGQGFAFETRSLRARDGVYRWHLSQAVPLRDADGKLLKFVGTSTDIDEQKRAQEELRASEGKLRRVIDAIPTLSWCNLADGPNEFLSKSWHQYTGLSPEEAHGWGWSAAFHPDDLPPLMKRWQQLLVSGDSGEIEARIRRHDGEYRWFLIRVAPFRDDSGVVVRWYGTSTDIHDRKLADEALRASESNLRQTVNSIPGFICTMSPAGEIEQLNQPLLEYFGKTPEELKSWRMTDAVHPDDLPEVVKAYTYSIASGSPYAIEHRCRRADGVYRWFQVRALAVRDADNHITGWYVLLTDIDDRRRAEDELKRSEARHRVVVETASDAVVSIDERGAIILANPAIKRIFGYNPEELIGKPMTMLMPGAMRKLHETGLKRYLETGERRLNWQGTEVTALRSNGEEFPAEVSFGEMVSNHRKVFTGFIRDISEKKRAEDALRASEAQLRETLDNIPALVCSISPKGQVLYPNRPFLEFFGKTAEEMMAWRTNDVIHPDHLPRVIAEFTHAMTTGTRMDMEVRYLRADGAYRWTQLQIVPVRDTDGRITVWYSHIIEIEDRKRAQKALGELQSELAHMARVSSLGALSASIVHEINQPISGMVINASACLRTLSKDPPGIDSAREAAQRMIRDSKRLSEVISRLRALFGKKESTTEPIDLNEAAREVVALCSDEIQKNHVILRQEFANDLPPVRGDRVQLQQVILNLLRNASDAMSGVEGRPRELVIRTARDETECVRLTVQDTGVGIPPQDMGKLFEAFYTTKGGGMGMGLSISRTIVESHKGRLWATPNDGPGATFSFSIPGKFDEVANRKTES